MKKYLLPILLLTFSGLKAYAQIGEVNPCDTSTLGPNLTINGDLSAGNTGFTTTYTYCNTTNCLFPMNNWGYSVATNAISVHNLFVGSDHTTGTGNFLIVNGQDSSLTAWQQTVAVTPGSNYSFSLWASSMDTLPHPGSAIVKVLINGASIGTFTVPAALNTWARFSAPWYSGTSSSATITIRDAQTDWNGFDYGIDDIKLQKCGGGSTAMVSEYNEQGRITVRPNPSDGHFFISDLPVNAGVEVFNMYGRKILPAADMEMPATGDLDLSRFPAGMYLVRITDHRSQTSQTEKVIICK